MYVVLVASLLRSDQPGIRSGDAFFFFLFCSRRSSHVTFMAFILGFSGTAEKLKWKSRRGTVGCNLSISKTLNKTLDKQYTLCVFHVIQKLSEGSLSGNNLNSGSFRFILLNLKITTEYTTRSKIKQIDELFTGSLHGWCDNKRIRSDLHHGNNCSIEAADLETTPVIMPEKKKPVMIKCPRVTKKKAS